MTNTRPADLDPITTAVNAAVGQVTGRIGVACSGGADSLALAHAAIVAAGPARVVVLAIDHGLQAASGAVAARVAGWARGQGAEAIVRRVEVADRASVEAAARAARYAALAELADEHALAAVFTGHTARDQAETVLMRIVRGTGPAGLAGIPRARALHDHACSEVHPAADAPRLVRPLLAVPRAAIDAYAERHALPVWDDPMNADPSLLRTRVRGALLPALRHENPHLEAALVRLAASAAEWLEVIDARAAPLATRPLDCARLAAEPPAIRKRALALWLAAEGLGYDAAHLDALDALVLRADDGQHAVDLPDARVVRTYGRLDRARAAPAAPPLVAPAGHELRAWRPGDRMRPARLHGRSKKLSDLFIDAKVPRDQRVGARVLVRISDGVIVWAEHLGTAHQEAETSVPRPPE